MKQILILIAFLGLLVGCQPSPAIPTVTTSQPPITIPSGTDATAALQATLDSTKYLYVNKNYIVNGTINPPNGSQIVFGSGGQFTRTSSAPLVGTLPVISLTKGNVVLKNPRIIGPNPCYWTYFDTGYKYSQYDTKREWNHGISITAGSDYLIDNPVISSVWGDAIYIGRGPSNMTINNLNANCVGRSIVSNTGSTNVTINGGQAYGAFWWTFNIEPFGNHVVRSYNVSNFRVGFSRGQVIFSGGPDFNCQVYDVTFTGLTYTTAYTEKSIQNCVKDEIVIK